MWECVCVWCTYDGQTTCFPFFPFFVDLPSLEEPSCQQHCSSSSPTSSFSPGVIVASGHTHTNTHASTTKKKKIAKVLAEESSRVVSVKLPKGTKITMAGKQRSETSEHRPSTFPTRTFHMLFLNKTVWLDATCLLEEEREEEKKTLSIAVEKFA